MCHVSIFFCHECGLSSQIFRKNILKSASCNFPIVKLILKVLSVPIPLYSIWHVYQTCSLLRLLRAPACCKKKKKVCFYSTVFLCMFVFILKVSVFTNTNVYSNKNLCFPTFPLSQFPIRKIHPDICVWKMCLARCCLHSLRLTQSEVHGTITHSLVVQHNRS